MNTYSLLRVTKQFEGLRVQVRYKKWTPKPNANMLNKLPTMSPVADPLDIEDKFEKSTGSSHAMKEYLDRVQSYNKFMAEERTTYEIGKRHLANMMGRDPDTFTQKDVDKSIQYLFPSSLFQREARPMMKPPEDIFPAKKEAEFDESGRPFHFLFYTTRPSFYQVMHDASKILIELNEYEDRIIRGEETNTKNFSVFPLDTSTWIEREVLEKKYQEFIHENEFNYLKVVLERIASHPYGSKYANFILQFCFPLTEKHAHFEALKPLLLEDGRQRLFIPFIKRRSVVVSVSVTYPGTGQFLIDNKDLRFFGPVASREAVLYPLVLTDMLRKVDVEAQVLTNALKGGQTALAIAVRQGVSQGLFPFVDEITKTKMKLAGLLTQEIRQKERKKPGQEGARRKFTWRKR